MNDALKMLSSFASSLSPEKREALLEILRPPPEPVAIVGMGCRFPGGATSPERFWELLHQGIDGIEEVPPDRWDAQAYYSPDPDVPGKMVTRWGGFVHDVRGFDAGLFGIAPREAQRMDPQQRLLLEVAWESLENAGLAPDRLAGTETGVFIGMCTRDYARMVRTDSRGPDLYGATGTADSVAAGRLSYLLGLHGPAMVLDTACSSSLVALHLAMQSLRSGECAMALAGGVNLQLSPDFTLAFSKARMMARDGRCKTFDAAADGYVRGDGCGIVVLKRLGDALRSRDFIHAVIRGSAVNQDGRSSGLTAPNGQAQEELLRKSLRNAGVSPQEVDYIEAHGTGTSLGDPIEIDALAAALGEGHSSSRPLWVGSVKTNIGHLEGAAGIAGLLKVVLALQHREIPSHLHFRDPSPFIPWTRIPLAVPTRNVPWESTHGPRIAGISSFGFSGTNAHVVVQEAPEPPQSAAGPERSHHLLTLSARSPAALRALAGRFAAHLERHPSEVPGDLCYTANRGRASFAHRLAVVGATSSALQAALRRFDTGGAVAQSAGDAAPSTTPQRSGSEIPEEPGTGTGTGTIPGPVPWGDIRNKGGGAQSGVVPEGALPGLAFLFSGQGAQSVGMGRFLYDTEPRFRQFLQRCDAQLRPRLGASMLSILFPDADVSPDDAAALLHQTRNTQPVLFSFEMALADLWQSWGIRPTLVMGHSLGEYAAACVAGVIGLEEALDLVATRARLMDGLPRDGQMSAVLAPEPIVREALEHEKGEVSIAAVNGPEETVISGRTVALMRVTEALGKRGFRCRRLQVSHAFHSPLMEPILDAFEAVLSRIALSPPRIPLIANRTGTLAASDDITRPAWWLRQLREPVRFSDGIRTAYGEGCRVFLEVGPGARLAGMGARSLPAEDCTWLSSLREGRDDWEQLQSSLGALFVRGWQPDWEGYDRSFARRSIPLPTYPFQHELPPATSHPLLAGPARASGEDHIVALDLTGNSSSFLNAHRVFGRALLPASAYLEVVLAAARSVEQWAAHAVDQLAFHEPLFLEDPAPHCRVVLTPDVAGGQVHFKLQSRIESPDRAGVTPSDADESGSGWTAHASGTLSVFSPAGSPEDPPDQVRSRCVQVPVDAYYRSMHGIGLEHGPAFQGIEALYRGTGEALASVRLPDGLRTDAGRFIFHPALLDACMQVMGLSWTDEDQAVFLPVALGRCALPAAPESTPDGAGPLWSHAILRASSERDTHTVDVFVTDSAGARVAELHGLRVKRATPASLRRPGTSPGQYEVRWIPAALPAAPHVGQAGAIPSRWIVFCDDGGVGEALAGRLEQNGHTTVRIMGGRSTPEAISRALEARELELEGTLTGVVYCWGMDGTDCDDAQLEHNVLDRCARALRVVQALARRPGMPPRLWMVTRGVQAIPAWPEGVAASTTAGLLQSPLWGMAAVVAQEYPGLQCTCVDLEPQITPPDGSVISMIDALELELRADLREDRVALRHDGRFVARLVPAAPAASGGAVPIHSDRAYLVTGGLGALGLQVARWLADQGARHLVLVGRREASGPASTLIKTLEARGIAVMAAACDVTRAEALEALLGRCRQTLPPIAGVVHASGVVDDAGISSLGPEKLSSVLAPKTVGAWNLHRLTRDLPLDFFVLFSSASTLFGKRGQAGYAAANAFLDGLAHLRRAEGRPAVSIDWGPWADAGQAATLADSQKARHIAQGIRPLAPADALAALGGLLTAQATQVAVLSMDWSAFAATTTGGLPLFSQVGTRSPSQVGTRASSQAGMRSSSQVGPRSEPHGSSHRADRPAPQTLLSQLQAALPGQRHDLLLSHVQARAMEVLDFTESATVGTRQPLHAIGLDSLMALELRDALSRSVGQPLSASLVFDHPTLEDITTYLLKDVLALPTTSPDAQQSAPEVVVSRAQDPHEPIAVVGLACRFPGGASTPEAFWELLRQGVDAVTEIPPERWDLEEHYDPDPDRPGRIYSRWGGFLPDIDRFDARFFSISPREASSLDPQQRLLLEVCWEALENAGQAPDRLEGSLTGVFMGISHSDYSRFHLSSGDLSLIDAYSGTGSINSVATGRISYVLGLQGPNMAIDTACSSSLVATHLACQSLRSGESSLALAGGVNLVLLPEYSVYSSRLRAMSPDGRCKAFDASANGYVRSEGCGVIVLKRLSDARAAGDPVLAVIRGSAVNHDGRASGLTAPSGPAQEAVLKAALDDAGVDPSVVGYVEAHGTGTPLGDPIEVKALGAVLSRGRPPEQKVWLASVKSNLGHLETAAGAAGLIKAVLALQHRAIPPHLHFRQPSPHVALEAVPAAVPTALEPWEPIRGRRIVGVSSFGVSGTNAHVVLEEAPATDARSDRGSEADGVLPVESGRSPKPPPPAGEGRGRGRLAERPEGGGRSTAPYFKADPASIAPHPAAKPADLPRRRGRHRQTQPVSEAPPRVIPLSARSPEALAALARRWADFLAGSDHPLEDIGHTAAHRRSHLEHRLALVCRSRAELLEQLEAFSDGRPGRGIVSGAVPQDARRKLVFVFPGQGSQSIGMGQALFRLEPAFRAHMERCDAIIRRQSGRSMLEDFLADETNSRLDEIDILQPVLLSIQLSIAAFWRSVGIVPDAVVGQSMGEVGAACVAGALSLEDALAVICRRSRILRKLRGKGAMALIELPLEQARVAIHGYEDRLAIATAAGPRSVVVAGEPAAVQTLTQRLEKEGIFCRSVKTDVATHCPQVEPLQEELLEALADIQPALASIPFYSTVLDRVCSGLEVDAGYWYQNMRQSVLFHRSILRLLEGGYNTFLEISPHPALLPAIEQTARSVDRSALVLPSLRRGEEDTQTLRESLASLYVVGVSVDWDALHPTGSPVRLPNYPWQKESFWVEKTAPAGFARGRPAGDGHPVLGAHIESSLDPGDHLWEMPIDAGSPGWLEDHRVGGQVLAPAALYLELALKASRQAFGAVPLEVREVGFSRALLLSKAPTELQVTLKQGSLTQGSLTHGTLTHGTLKQNTANEASFQVSSRTSNGAETSPWVRHAQATVRVLDRAEGLSGDGAGLLDAWRAVAETGTGYAPQQCYAQFEARGIGYGPAFQGIRALWAGVGEAAAQLELPQRLAREAARCEVHPVLLDSCLQVLMAAFPEFLEPASGVFVPIALERLVVWKPPGQGGRVLARRSAEGDLPAGVLRGDVWLLDEDGAVVLEVRGISARHVDPAQLGMRDALSELFFEVEWRPQPIPDTSGHARAATAIDIPGSWLVFADREGLGEQVAAQLEALGYPSVLVYPGAQLRERRPGVFDLNPASPGDFDRLLQGAFPGDRPPCRGILHLWSLGIGEAEPGFQAGCGSTLLLVQALSRIGWRQPVRLWMVTRGAQAVRPGEPISVFQAPLWGMGRVIGHEHPELKASHLDLEGAAGKVHGTVEPGRAGSGSRPDAEEIPALVAELLENGHENQVAFREGRRFVARLVPSRRVTAPPPSIEEWPALRPDRTYLITGGLRGLGLTTARWMVDHGARFLALVGRSDPDEEAAQAIRALEARGARIDVMRADIGDREAVRRLLDQVAAVLPPLAGIVHSAGVLDDGILLRQTGERFQRVMAPKVDGAWYLHEMTRDLPLELFVLYASASSLLGSPGQANHAAANAFLDALAHHRQALGLPAVSIDWGTWAEVGYVAENTEAFAMKGMASLTVKQGLEALRRALYSRAPQLAVMPLNVRQWREIYVAVADSPLLEALVQSTAPASAGSTGPALREQLAGKSLEASRAVLQRHVAELVTGVLRLDAEKLEADQPFSTLGIDSLMGLEIRNRLESSLGLTLSATLLWTYATSSALASYLADRLAGPGGSTAAAPPGPMASAGPGPSAASIASTASIGSAGLVVSATSMASAGPVVSATSMASAGPIASSGPTTSAGSIAPATPVSSTGPTTPDQADAIARIADLSDEEMEALLLKKLESL